MATRTKHHGDREKPVETYEDLYVPRYKPGVFAGPMPNDPRPKLVMFIVEYIVDGTPVLTFGPTHDLWAILEFTPPSTYNKFPTFIHEILIMGDLGRQVTKTFRWNGRKEEWVRIAKGPLNQ